GGWPDGVTRIVQDFDGEVKGLIRGASVDMYEGGIWRRSHGTAGNNYGVLPVAIDRATSIVTREQYEAALAAAQQPVWGGDGLPPVSYECEAKYRLPNAEWFIFRCVGIDCGVAFGWAGKEAVTLDIDSYEFRPIRPEADTKRAAGVTALAKAGGAVDFEYGRKTIDGELSAPGWYELYDKIAAGEIAGIRIE
ncbi:hypothetical protein QNX21_002229, partial [Cronobacter sakazakii]|nr:hypothetical protein [Cronobacter sakazakii]